MRRRSCNWSTLQGVKRIDATFQGKLIPIYALVLFLSLNFTLELPSH